jgi:glycosyltransferase involved in cell wall biosynthesis
VGCVPTGPKTRDPSVSVIVPVRNGERYLAETLDSIVNQTLSPQEIIVVDDGSQDSSADIARSFGGAVRVIHSMPLGGGAARDIGVAEATSDLIALCDADDVWMPDKLARQVTAVHSPDDAVAVFSGATEFLSPELPSTSLRTRQPMQHIARAQMSSALMATRAAFDAVGPFQTEDNDGMWFTWCLRLTDSAVTVMFVDGELVRRRLHDHNQSLNTAPSTATWPAALHAHLRQRRTGQP